MRFDDIQIGKMYEARVPGDSAREQTKFRPVLVVAKADSYEHGDAPMVVAVYKAPLSPRGQRVALVRPEKIRLHIPQRVKAS